MAHAYAPQGAHAMNIMKHILLASAAAMTIAAGDASAASVKFFAGNVPTLCMPHATVAVGQALSPHAIAVSLTKKRFRVQAMHRRGAAYAVRAIGPSGNHVDMMVDGSSGTIIGLNVLQAVAGSIVSAMTAQNAVYVDDRHSFGAVVPEVVYDSWQSYGENQWSGASAETVAVERTYAGYRAAVPFNFMHFNARSGHSYAIAPPRYHGFRLTNARGQQIRTSETRAQMANEEAAYQSERADQSDWDKQVAQQDATDANERADQLDQENDRLADVADRESQRADDAEAKNADLQKQLDDQGTANQEVADTDQGGDTGDTSDSTVTNDDQGGASDQTATDSTDQGGSSDDTAAAPTDQGGSSDDTAAAPTDQGGADDQQTAAPQDQGGSSDETAAAPTDQGGADDQQTAAPQDQDQGGSDEQQAAPQDQGGGDEQQAAPQDDGGSDQQMDQGGGGDDNSGGGDDSGGGGDDSGGGGDDGN